MTVRPHSAAHDLYVTSRQREVREISSQLDMLVLRTRALGTDPAADRPLQEVIAKRDQILADLASLLKLPDDEATTLRDRIDAEINELDKLSHQVVDALRR